VSATNQGLFQSSSYLPWGTWENGTFDAWDVERNWVGRDGCTRYFHEEAKATWLWCEDGTFITWDDAEAISHKLAFIETEGLGGAMIWSLDGDLRPGDELLTQVAEALR
jgi:chitinase